MSTEPIDPATTRIGWIGTGVMGFWMCQHLIDAGYQATVFNRSIKKTQPLVARGAILAGSPREVAKNSDVVFLMVGFPEDVREVLLGDQGAIAGSSKGTILVDMTTSRPQLAVEIDAACTSKGLHAVDAPVSGGDIGAQTAGLSIMIGGDAEIVERLHPCWTVMGKTIVHQGGPGAGQHAKMVNQTLIAGNMVAVCEGLLYGHAAGLDLANVLRSVTAGAAGSWSLTNLAPRIIEGDFEPGFYVEHFIKDLGIALDEAASMGISLPGLALAKQLYEAVRAQGNGRAGTQALMLAIAGLSGKAWPAEAIE